MNDTTYTDPTKPGYLTTEFWVNIFTQIVSAAMAVFSLFGHHLDGSVLQPLIGVASLLAMAISSAWYTHGRSNVKVGISQSIAAMPAEQLPGYSYTAGPAVPTDLGADPTNSGGEQTLSDAQQQAAMASRSANGN